MLNDETRARSRFRVPGAGIDVQSVAPRPPATPAFALNSKGNWAANGYFGKVDLPRTLGREVGRERRKGLSKVTDRYNLARSMFDQMGPGLKFVISYVEDYTGKRFWRRRYRHPRGFKRRGRLQVAFGNVAHDTRDGLTQQPIQHG